MPRNKQRSALMQGTSQGRLYADGADHHPSETSAARLQVANMSIKMAFRLKSSVVFAVNPLLS